MVNSIAFLLFADSEKNYPSHNRELDNQKSESYCLGTSLCHSYRGSYFPS